MVGHTLLKASGTRTVICSNLADSIISPSTFRTFLYYLVSPLISCAKISEHTLCIVSGMAVQFGLLAAKSPSGGPWPEGQTFEVSRGPDTQL